MTLFNRGRFNGHTAIIVENPHHYTLTYTIKQAGSISQSYPLIYKIRATVQDDFELKYKLKVKVKKEYTLRYDLGATSETTIPRTLQYFVLVETQKSYELRYSIKYEIVPYDINRFNRTAFNRTAFNRITEEETTRFVRELVYYIKKFTTLSYTTKYSIIKEYQQSYALQYVLEEEKTEPATCALLRCILDIPKEALITCELNPEATLTCTLGLPKTINLNCIMICYT